MEGLHTLLQEHRQAIGWITTISGVVFVGSLLLVPWIVVRIPEDYLIRDNTKERSSSPDRSSPTIQSWLLVIVRNGAGALLGVCRMCHAAVTRAGAADDRRRPTAVRPSGKTPPGHSDLRDQTGAKVGQLATTKSKRPAPDGREVIPGNPTIA